MENLFRYSDSSWNYLSGRCAQIFHTTYKSTYKIPISRKVKQLAVEFGVRTIRFKYFNCIMRSFDIWAVVTLFQAPELKVNTGMNIILWRDINVLIKKAPRVISLARAIEIIMHLIPLSTLSLTRSWFVP